MERFLKKLTPPFEFNRYFESAADPTETSLLNEAVLGEKVKNSRL